MRKLMSVVFLSFFFFLPASPFSASAESSGLCDKRTEMIRGFEERFGESVFARGLVLKVEIESLIKDIFREPISGGSILEITTSRDGTWSFIKTNPNGESCYLYAGNEMMVQENGTVIFSYSNVLGQTMFMVEKNSEGRWMLSIMSIPRLLPDVPAWTTLLLFGENWEEISPEEQEKKFKEKRGDEYGI